VGAPGHTPGSVLIHAKNAHGHAVFSGDVIHHPIQLVEPSLAIAGEYNAAMARQTRNNVLESCADSGALLLPAHFPAPTAAHVVDGPGGLRFDFDRE